MAFDVFSLVGFRVPGVTRLELLVLLSLQAKPLHGYGVMKRLGRSRKVESGSLYPLLARMRDKGLLRTEKKGRRTRYALTAYGHEVVEGYASAVRELSSLFKRMSR